METWSSDAFRNWSMSIEVWELDVKRTNVHQGITKFFLIQFFYVSALAFALPSLILSQHL